eukprot:TRINITY_DN11043_c0_g1_i1.p1 TRINITY_DN11043_c0_g1~~TRINITY_DN11043_c0_g1_i1.p1  ORF type:complete len:123 (-),score=28.42 TRINITY_DN11043_c0_g1_i1:19-351(-)
MSQEEQPTINGEEMEIEEEQNPQALTESVVRQLLEAGANVNAATSDGQTPLMKACQYQPTIVPILLEHGADASIVDNEGRTALTIAEEHNPSLVASLQQYLQNNENNNNN